MLDNIENDSTYRTESRKNKRGIGGNNKGCISHRKGLFPTAAKRFLDLFLFFSCVYISHVF
jgi:hypothetical protein